MKTNNKIVLLILLIISTSNFLYLNSIIDDFHLDRFTIVNLVLEYLTALGLIFLLYKAMKKKSEFEKEDINYNCFENFFIKRDVSKKITENKYEKLLNCIDIGYAYFKIVRDELGNLEDAEVLEVNKALIGILEERREALLKYSLKTFLTKYVGKEYDYEKALKDIEEDGQYKLEDYISIGDNKWIKISICRMKNDTIAVIIIDVSDRKSYLDEMRYLANYDVLTDTKNRYSIYNHMTNLKKRKKDFAIFFLDLDNFRMLNDNLGHNLGDQVLHKVAAILRKHENEAISIGRLGGDEFLIILEDNISKENIERLGQAILRSLNTYYINQESYSYNIKASLGVSIFNRDTDDIGTLIKFADIAMYHSKKNGGNNISIFKGEMLKSEMKKVN
ncbi:GGDEF domain-containing protein [Clostridium sp. HBUAS56017]|uniref:GGDEF domain-containing protein n=1 Tax=Clostridium sp. HBUAS56017 TaxID=2571128 RepID=UPI0011788351|nr:GGDEF domain-containing protein [Clostridium sp. HBUAS56017]